MARILAASKRSRGRPTRLTPTLTRQLCALLSVGVPPATAAQKLRVGVRSFWRWLAIGRRVDFAPRNLVMFAHSVEQALAQFEVRLYLELRFQTAADPATNKWILERRYASRWGSHRFVEASNAATPSKVGGVIIENEHEVTK